MSTVTDKFGDHPVFKGLFSFQDRVVNFATRNQRTLLQQVAGGKELVQLAVANTGRYILYVDMGLGKSRMGLAIYQALCKGEPLLIIGTKRSLNTWRREIQKWGIGTLDEITLVIGSPQQRAHMWRNPTKFMATTYDCAIRDLSWIEEHIKQQRVRKLVFDEAQKMRNKKTRAFTIGKYLSARVEYVGFLSGTLITRGPQDLWTFLHMCRPKAFSSYWRFAGSFCYVIEGQYGKELVGARNTEALAKQLSGYLVRLRDTDPEVVKHRPKMIREIVPIDPTSEQIKLQEDFIRDSYITRSDGTILASPNAGTSILKMRQLMVCPKILDPSLGYGASIEHVLDTLEEYPHPVIFSPFRQGIEFIRLAILDYYENDPSREPFVLMGGRSPDDVKRVEDEFNSEAGQSRACLCTTQFAESFELYSSRHAYHIGFDWSQLVNYQADKRLHRLITKHVCTASYLVGFGTVEEDVLSILNRKQTNTNVTMQDYINVLADRINRRGGTR